jgi:hypothetical protein
MGVKLKGILEADGSTVEIVVNESELGGAKSLSSLLKYNYNTTPTPPPSSSQVRTDGSVAVDTTKVWVHRIDNANVDNKFFLMQAKKGDQLFVQDVDNSDSHVVLTLVADPTDNGTYLTFDVECDSVGGTPLQGTAVMVGLFL